MNLWAILLVYASLSKPVHLFIPTTTLAFETNAECLAVSEHLYAKHAFDKKGYQLVYGGCERVMPVYRTTGAKTL